MKMKFGNPPINELIIGVYFESPIQKLRTEHIGLIWTRLRDHLPTVEQKAPIVTRLQPRLTILNEPDLFQRYWFVSEDSASLIQIQRDAFIHNWRRKDSEYPRYSKQVKPKFDKYYSIFESFIEDEVKEDRPRIGICELAYVDVVDICDYWKGPQDTAKVIPSLAESLRGFGNEPAIAVNNVTLFKPKSDIELSVGIRTTQSTNGSEATRLLLEFRARGHMGGVLKADTDSWFSDAHETILEWFSRLTSKEIQREYWNLEEQ